MEPIPSASLAFAKERFGDILDELHKREQLNQDLRRSPSATSTMKIESTVNSQHIVHPREVEHRKISNPVSNPSFMNCSKERDDKHDNLHDDVHVGCSSFTSNDESSDESENTKDDEENSDKNSEENEYNSDSNDGSASNTDSEEYDDNNLSNVRSTRRECKWHNESDLYDEDRPEYVHENMKSTDTTPKNDIKDSTVSFSTPTQRTSTIDEAPISSPSQITTVSNNNIESSGNDNTLSSFKVENRYFLACSLVRSSIDSDIQDGILLLQEISQSTWNRKEVLFHLCLGNFKSRNLVQAKLLCQKLLMAYPMYKNGLDMLKLFEYEVQELRKSRKYMVAGQAYSSLVASSPLNVKGIDRPSENPNIPQSVQELHIDSLSCPTEYKEIFKSFTDDEVANIVECFMKISENGNILGVFDKEQFGENLSILKFNDFVYTHVFEFFKQSSTLLRKKKDIGVTFEDGGTTINFTQFLLTMGILLRGAPEMQLELAFEAMNAREKKGYITEADVQYYIEMIIEMLHYLSLETIPVDRITKHIIKELKNDSNIYRLAKQDAPEVRITKDEFINNGKKNYGRIVGLGILMRPSSFKDVKYLRRGVHSICGSKRFKDVLNIMTGIRLASDMFKPLHREIMPIDFSTNIQFSIIHQKGSTYMFIDYAPRVFKKIRSNFHILESDFLISTSPEIFFGKLLFGSWSALSETQSDGRSGAYFYYTDDGRYIIKNIPQAESAALRRTLSSYYSHLKTYKYSFLVRYLSLFDYNKKSYCIMENAFSTPREIHEIYDIKGSVVARSNPDGRVKKDNDLKQVLEIGKDKRDRVLRLLWCDIDSLLNLKFTDYSLLVGIHYVDGPPAPVCESGEDQDGSFNRGPLTQMEQRAILEKEQQNLFTEVNFDLSDIIIEDGGIYSNDRKQIYYFSIIDTLTEYTWTKSAERSIKTIKYGTKRRNQISSQPPEDYALRLKAFIAKILK